MTYCVFLLLLSVPRSAVAAGADQPLRVFVSILPEKYFVERIAGPRARVSVMVEPGQSPATYDPRPSQIATLAKADIYFRVGAPFEAAWVGRIRAANAGLPIVDLSEGVNLRRIDAPAGGAALGVPDPHLWTNPRLASQMSQRIRDALVRLDPANRAEHERNYAVLAADLVRLDDDVRAQLAPLRRREFLVFHPSWGYFADAYGLRQIPIESSGKEPGPRTLSRVIAEARSRKIRVILVQPQFSRRTAEFVAREVGAQIVLADPLAEDYILNIRRVAAALATADDRQ